jgi:hypothetical protein
MWYYMVSFIQKDLWDNYAGQDTDMLEIEIFENWLENTN